MSLSVWRLSSTWLVAASTIVVEVVSLKVSEAAWAAGSSRPPASAVERATARSVAFSVRTGRAISLVRCCTVTV